MKISTNEDGNAPSHSSDNSEINSTNNSHQDPVSLNTSSNVNTTEPNSAIRLNHSPGHTETSQGRIAGNKNETHDKSNDADVTTLNNNCAEVTSLNNNNNNINNNINNCYDTFNNQFTVERSSSKRAITEDNTASSEEIENKHNLEKCLRGQDVHPMSSASPESTNTFSDISQTHHVRDCDLTASDSNASTNYKINRALLPEDGEYSSVPYVADHKLYQHPDLIQVTPDNGESFPEYLQTLIEGKSVCGDSYVPFSKPHWLDMEKFRRGQRFALNHIFGVMYAELLSLMILFAFRGGLEPLIFTGKSDTPFKAFKRYLSTVLRVRSWYDEDIWDENSLAHKNLKVVRALHESTRKCMTSCPKEDVAKRVTLENDQRQQPMLTDLREEILEDFQTSCPMLKASLKRPNEVYINQFDMGFTQFGFAGLILTYPKMFGIYWVSDEDLEGFVHFWRTIGYLLGTEDRFNLCVGDLQTVQQRCRDIIEFWVKPKFRSISRDWIHMSRCLFIGVSFYIPGVTFEVLLLYLCRVLNIQALKLKASLTFWQYVYYLQTIFIFSFIIRLPGMWRLHNWLIDKAVKKAQNMSPERITRLEQRVYPYEASS